MVFASTQKCVRFQKLRPSIRPGATRFTEKEHLIPPLLCACCLTFALSPNPHNLAPCKGGIIILVLETRKPSF